ncbi:MAG: ATP-binding protein [Spirochaetota bacterium]|mgnify:CR=1 FL=1
MPKAKKSHDVGKLKIGDSWNAITIIALSQNNPLKAIAEFVENSIDAKAANIQIVRGKNKGETYLRIIDDGNGIPPDEEGNPNFKYVATHICDSIKRKLKEDGASGLQGEFGIGLLSFWTIGKRLTMTSTGENGKSAQMHMEKDNQGFSITPKRALVPSKGTELYIAPLLAGIRSLSGEKIQNYLASELRDRIKRSGAAVTIIDKLSRKELPVVPREFSGQLLHALKAEPSAKGELYHELYLTKAETGKAVGLYRNGTRVLDAITRLDEFAREPWTSGMLEGLLDAPYLNLTPGTRDGIIRDESFAAFIESAESLESELMQYVGKQRAMEEEESAKTIQKTVEKAFRDAFTALPREEYDWLAAYGGEKANDGRAAAGETEVGSTANSAAEKNEQKKFFEHPGPLYKAAVSPRRAIIRVGETKSLSVRAYDRKGIAVDSDLSFLWKITDGGGTIDNTIASNIVYSAANEPGITTIQASVAQAGVSVTAEALVTVTDSIIEKAGDASKKGLPGYTYQRAPGELWRSRFDADENLIYINSAHGDFIFASKAASRKIRYILRLFCKEMVLHNFMGQEAAKLLERMIELTLYTEENL